MSSRQKLNLLESILENNEYNLFFNLSDPNVDVNTIPTNVFVRLTCKLRVPEMIDMINGVGTLLSGKLGDLAQENIKFSQDENFAKIMLKLFSEKTIIYAYHY